ncbi:hypothetical protein FOL47_006566 [Perkinsus chesapeaki]|uniref:ADP-ribosylation factor-like protein 6 n=1 Tax=Perkinsus chesapeaki TaxID=330153 RepID=A0A7J6LRT9_PERCH|nr:hypothetical protein FOL47_006566 [Perkinsus chesapeaki]
MTKPAVQQPSGEIVDHELDEKQVSVESIEGGDEYDEFVPPPSVIGGHQARIPLITAAVEGKMEEVEHLLTSGKSKVDEKDFNRRTALMHAAARGLVNVVEVLLRHGAKVTAKDQRGETAIMKASKGGHVDCIKLLLDAQLRRQRASSTGLTLEEMAEVTNFTLSEKQRILDVKNEEGQTALIKAAEAGCLESMKALVQMKASVDTHDDEGWNALMWASLEGHLPVVEWLVEEQLQDVNFASEKTSESPLIKAAVNGHVGVCRYLIKRGAKVNHHDYNYQDALMWAAARGHLPVVELLLGHGAKVNHQTRTGKTALMLSSLYGHTHIAKFLLDNGANMEIEDEDGCTALFFTVGADDPETCELLIERGCKIDDKNHEGETASMLAERDPEMGILRRLFGGLLGLRRTRMRFIVVGLDNSGKTTLLNQLKPAKVSLETVPTVGFSIEEFSNHGINFCAFDMSGQGKYRSLWEHYYPDCEGIIFVIDSTDQLRFAVAREELQSMLQSVELAAKPNVPVIFFANKMDLSDASTLEEVSAAVGLDFMSSHQRPFHVVRCCATTGEGVEEGIMWLAETVKRNRSRQSALEESLGHEAVQQTYPVAHESSRGDLDCRNRSGRGRFLREIYTFACVGSGMLSGVPCAVGSRGTNSVLQNPLIMDARNIVLLELWFD